MNWLMLAGAVVLALAALMGIAAIVGSRLPVAHVSSREATVAAPPESIWQAITDIDAFAKWRPGVSSVERLPDRAGKQTWVEKGSNGRITYTVDRADPPRLLVVRIADPDLPFGGTWTYDITPVPGGSRVCITERGEIYNPLFRFMARYVFGYEKTIAGYLASLEKRLATAV